MIKIMDIGWDAIGRFNYRKNRFLAYVDIISPFDEKDVPVHVHDPGRLKEILVDGAELLLRKALSPNRKTCWDVIAAKVDSTWVIINSSLHSDIAHTLLKNEVLHSTTMKGEIRREVGVGDSRLDFLITFENARTWVEVKGCTLTCGNVALFPDAPTKRGTKHLNELSILKKQGDSAAVIFLILGPKAESFSPNHVTDPLFSKMLANANNIGVDIFPLLLSYNSKSLFFDSILPLIL